MASRRKKGKAVFNAVDVASIAKSNPYVQRLIEDAKLRDNVQKAIESTRSAYGRMSNGKAPARALLEDRKLQSDLSDALSALRDASLALSEAPKRRVRRGRRLGRKIVVLALGGGLALVGSEKLRTKVLDTLFGKEEEFQYTPPASTATTPASTTSVGAA
jgi:hypothetical protein